jgi:hypothetical protein
VYESALAADDQDALVAAISRNVFGASEPPLGARQMAAYMRQAAHRLGRQAAESVVHGEIDFPDPDSVAGCEGRPNS